LSNTAMVCRLSASNFSSVVSGMARSSVPCFGPMRSPDAFARCLRFVPPGATRREN
jgi:hypothetical protein